MRDNGTGFDTSATHDETHVGVKIMHERAERIGAVVTLQAVADQGTTMTLSLPPNPVSGVPLSTGSASQPADLSTSHAA